MVSCRGTVVYQSSRGDHMWSSKKMCLKYVISIGSTLFPEMYSKVRNASLGNCAFRRWWHSKKLLSHEKKTHFSILSITLIILQWDSIISRRLQFRNIDRIRPLPFLFVFSLINVSCINPVCVANITLRLIC